MKRYAAHCVRVIGHSSTLITFVGRFFGIDTASMFLGSSVLSKFYADVLLTCLCRPLVRSGTSEALEFFLSFFYADTLLNYYYF